MTQERHNWLVDGSHTSNIHGSVRVGGRGMPAQGVTTAEVGLIRPIFLLTMAVNRTSTAGGGRVNVCDLHARTCCLVADKRSELPKSPGMAPGTLWVSLLPSNRYSLTNLCQILQSDCLTGRVRL